MFRVEASVVRDCGQAQVSEAQAPLIFAFMLKIEAVS
jgi:hypothetical protein